MDLELVVALSFTLAIVIQSIILIKNFFSTPTKEIFTPLLFRFISNGFIYISALLVLTTTFTDQAGLEALTLSNLQEITFGQFAIWATLVVILVTLLILGLGLFTNLGNNKKISTEKMIDQQKAKDIT